MFITESINSSMNMIEIYLTKCRKNLWIIYSSVIEEVIKTKYHKN